MTRKKRILIGLPIVLTLLILGFFYAIGAFSGFRVKQELTTFANALETCTPFAQDYLVPVLGQTMARSVDGDGESGCGVTFSAFGASAIRCNIPQDTLPKITTYFRNQAEATPYFDMFPSLEVNYNSSEEMDPLMALYSSPACTIEP